MPHGILQNRCFWNCTKNLYYNRLCYSQWLLSFTFIYGTKWPHYVSVNSSRAQTPPPRATVGHLPALSVPGVGHLQILHCQGARHLPTPGAIPSFCHALSFLSEYDYTEDFTRKTSRLARLSRMGKSWRGLYKHVLDFLHVFLHFLSSQNYIVKLRSDRRGSTFFWLLNQVSLDIIRRTSFHIYKTIHSS